ncbi:DNA polymerase epsilon catalytic subunit A [Chlorella sorokiniana]|uniref:DNA polymerase epsilon catalytic subunit n=1 Tax=Chlorella sorokiniana TaxID=3076 RepID=A0A2P6TCW5_CHLSO|nr:DNA polymerase epsilon catalytic subunit A [Chlorella sorokiniana]|eukprot:PRW20477.1 DNA polymerase epsilon catalytic subunit A [Chlorella sorokiniana]
MKKGNPAFGGIRGAGISSLRARDAHDGGGGGRGRGKRLLNRGMNLNNGNYIGKRSEAGGAGPSNEAREVKEDNHAAEAALGFPLHTDGPDRLGWLMNMNQSQKVDKESGQALSCVNCYFMCQDGSMFKAQVEYAPYFYLQIKDDLEMEVDSWLRRKFEGALKEVEIVHREDLDLKNHLSGLQRKLLKLTFWNQDQLMQVRREIQPIVSRNRYRRDGTSAYQLLAEQQRPTAAKAGKERLQDALESIVEMREHDVPYHVRFAIDTDVRCGHWFTCKAKGGKVSLERRADLLQRAEPRICAFDIETTKLPLQFPNAEYDQVFMISYMVDRQGYLIINREVVSEDIRDFEYTPKPEFEGPFHVFNCANEAACLRQWFDHMREIKPAIYVTYNGDYFDWPFIETRAIKNGMDMAAEIGFTCNRKTNETLSRMAVHMDCLHWVNRDSYLPQGSRGLKMVTKYKLGYDPVEVDPEDMVRLACEKPQDMASYSVSDAVATYYLYMTYIHPFIFSLSTIIPMPPDEVLRKGSGTLCEMLLMVQAYQASIVAPNKHTSASEKMYKGHLLESETYIGGKVEAIESGVFRSDLPCKFRCKPEAYQKLIDKLDGDLEYALRTDGKMAPEDCENYVEVREQIKGMLEALRDTPVRDEVPLIYHLDVAAMYPNIILTNRLQPSSIVTDEDCAACDFNRPGKTCLRQMEWVWRGETYSATRAEYASLKAQLQSETFPPAAPDGPQRLWTDLQQEEKAKLLKDRLKKYCQKVYKRVLDKPTTEKRLAGICQRENSFYVDTVRAFRDRRYEYKGLTKVWKGKLDSAKESGNPIRIQEAKDMCVLYDSLQLAHKCILNSFYGYVMRKGARWYSMEMAGVVTHTGANIIKRANELIGQLGKPLELDTDGIWCALPGSFPEDFKFKNASSGKVFKMSYPCAMLNVMVAEHNTNDQFATLVDPERKVYEVSSQMSIEFEVDGPYKAMILPASKEEGKLIKKRYAVFNFDGSLAELKGFELKRRGELKLIKVFQGEVFDQFLKGATLEECYAAVAAVANRWLDMLDTRGVDLTDEELIDHISEMCVMSKSLEEYEGRKSCAITCATRLSQFLGDDRIKDKGLVCNYVIARNPTNQPTSERAIPVAIFSTEPSVARTYLRKWCCDIGQVAPDQVPDVRQIVDWEYYKERLGSAIQKIITIPAAMQRVPNPVPRVRHPDWLHKKVQEKEDTYKQTRIDALFGAARSKRRPHLALEGGEQQQQQGAAAIGDLEDFGANPAAAAAAAAAGPVGIATSLDPEAAAAAGGEGENAAAAANQVEEDMPDRRTDFRGWLAAKKAQWRRSREARKRKRAEAAADGRPLRQRTGADVGAMFQQQAAAATAAHWQIVNIAPTAQPGVYKAWTVINGRMTAVPLRIPRAFYVDAAAAPGTPEADGFGQQVKRTLPGSLQPLHTYHVVMEEGEYRSQLPELQARLAAAGARGVWEERLPPELNAALQLGCVAVVAPSARSRTLGDGFDLAELHMRPVAQCEYFDAPGSLRHMTLHAAADPARGRALYALHLPADGRCQLWVVNPARGGQKELSGGAAERAWSEAAAALAAEAAATGSGSQVETPPPPRFEVAYVKSGEAALKQIQRELGRIKDRARAPTVLLLNSDEPAALRHSLPALADLPTAAMPLAAAPSGLPTLGWQLPAARAAVQQLLAAGEWLRARVAAAQYAHLPLASIGGDWILDAADALYARQLREAGHLLWAADPSQPDLDTKQVDRAEALTLREQQQQIEITFPGAYRCVCVELRISHLAVNAILEAATISELEGSTLLEDQHGCAPAFRVLKNLAQSWMDDATKRSNICADALLRNLYRWVCSPAARLYDPALKQLVQGLMQKLLLQLIAELQRLGATVVHADGSSLILCTGKRNLTAAVGYADYILDTLSKRELFQWLSLTPHKFWHTLLWKDRFNYLGILAEVPTALQEAMVATPGRLTTAEGGAVMSSHAGELALTQALLDRPAFDYCFCMKDYLPPVLHATFLAAVTEFVWLPWKAAQEAGLALDGATQGGSQAVRDAAESAEAQEGWLKEALPRQFTEKLLKQVKHMALHIGAADGQPDHAFPHLAGSHLSEQQLGTPALAFVRAVCHLYTLDGAVSDQVAVLRRQLLRLVHCKEFSADAEFKDPCLTLVLRDLICPTCQDCQDLDLCRDPAIQRHDWHCSACGTERDVAAVEEQLCGLLQQASDGYQLQDLRCAKCASVAASHLQSHCDVCGGHLKATQAAATARQQVSVLRNIAEYQDMPLLRELADWQLGGGAVAQRQRGGS